MLPINSREDDCWAGQKNNYRVPTMSGTTLGHIKTCLCCPELKMKTCKWGFEGYTSFSAITSSLWCSATSALAAICSQKGLFYYERDCYTCSFWGGKMVLKHKKSSNAAIFVQFCGLALFNETVLPPSLIATCISCTGLVKHVKMFYQFDF